MWRKSLMVGITLAFAVIVFTQSAWATDIEAFTTKWQDAQAILTGKWIKVMVYDGSSNDDKCWRNCELIIEPYGIIKGGKYVEVNGDTTKITGGKLCHVPGILIMGKIETKSRTLYVERGGIVGDRLVLGLRNNQDDPLTRNDMEADLALLSNSVPNPDAVRDFVTRTRVDADTVFPELSPFQ